MAKKRTDHHPIDRRVADLFTEVLDHLATLLPLAEQRKATMEDDPDPREPATAEITIGALFPDDDGFWELDRDVALGTYLSLGETANAHTRLQHQAVVAPLLAAFDALLDAVGHRAPALHRSHLRLSIDAYRRKVLGATPDEGIAYSVCIFGKAVRGVYDVGPTTREQGDRFAAFVAALAPLGAPTGWWYLESDGSPVAAAGAVEAAAIDAAIESTSWDLRTWLRTNAPHAAQAARALASPQDIQAGVARIRAQM